MEDYSQQMEVVPNNPADALKYPARALNNPAVVANNPADARNNVVVVPKKAADVRNNPQISSSNRALRSILIFTIAVK
jgi:hypothetical protein